MAELVYTELMQLASEKGFFSYDRLVRVYKHHYYLWMCELHKWVRDTHKIHVVVDRDQEYWKYELYTIHNGNKHIPRGFPNYINYEVAFEIGLLEALKLI